MRPMLASFVSWLRLRPWAFSSDKMGASSSVCRTIFAQGGLHNVVRDGHVRLLRFAFNGGFFSWGQLAVRIAVFFFTGTSPFPFSALFFPHNVLDLALENSPSQGAGGCGRSRLPARSALNGRHWRPAPYSRTLCLPCRKQEISTTPIVTPYKMALRWENPASTTHSLTQALNRPLIFWILTPRKKPGATGSAGRCDLGVGRFTDPHPFTCFFFTPPFCSAMFGLYEQPLQARPEPDFSFSAFLLPARPLACVDGLAFSHPVSPLSWFRSQLAHTPPTGWSGASLVSFLYPVLKLAKNRRTGASLDFLPRTSLPLPLKGEGAGYRLSWVCWVCPARAQLPHTAPTGPFWGLAGIRSLLSFQNRTQATQALVWFSPFFPPAFLLRQSRQILLQLVIHRLLDGADRVEQVPLRTKPALVFTFVGSVSISRFSSNCRMYFATVLALMPVCWQILPILGPALMRFPVLAEHQVSINRQFART